MSRKRSPEFDSRTVCENPACRPKDALSRFSQSNTAEQALEHLRFSAFWNWLEGRIFVEMLLTGPASLSFSSMSELAMLKDGFLSCKLGGLLQMPLSQKFGLPNSIGVFHIHFEKGAWYLCSLLHPRCSWPKLFSTLYLAWSSSAFVLDKCTCGRIEFKSSPHINRWVSLHMNF